MAHPNKETGTRIKAFRDAFALTPNARVEVVFAAIGGKWHAAVVGSDSADTALSAFEKVARPGHADLPRLLRLLAEVGVSEVTVKTQGLLLADQLDAA